MIKISDLDHIADNLETLGYAVEKTSAVYVYRKENNRFIIDIDIKEVRFYMKTKQWKYQKSFSFTDFEKETSDWIKKHKLLKGE